MIYGDWQGDSVPVWRLMNLADTSNLPNVNYLSEGVGGSWPAAGAAAWSGTGSLSGPNTNYTHPSILFQHGSSYSADWVQTWVTITRGSLEVTSGTLPSSVYSGGHYIDPNVVGVEWEPTAVPMAQRMTLTLGDSVNAPAVAPGQPVTFKRRTGTTFLTAAAVGALDTLATVTPATDSSRASVMFDPLTPLAGTAALTLTAVDSWTLTQTAPVDGGTGQAAQRIPYSVKWETAYTPRYRLLYDTAVTPPLRQVQRGDGQAIGGVPRAVQSRSQQATLRRGAAFM